MYGVSSDYLSAIRHRVRKDRLTGVLTLASGTVININDENLVAGSVKLERELCGSDYRIGTFNTSCLRFSFFIDGALGLDLTGAAVTMEYGLLVNDDEYETVPLGVFYADPVLSERKKNILTVTAYDAGSKADIAPSAALTNMVCTPAELIAAACAESGITTAVTAGSLDALPNSNIPVTAKSRQIQTCRDIIMWCSRLLCAYAVIGRDSELYILPAKYEVEQEDSSVIIADRTIREDERDSINVTDTRAYIKYLTAYKGDDTVNYTSAYTPADEQASPAAYLLEKNPLLCDTSENVQDAVNRAWLAYIDSFKQRGVKAVIYGDPAIDTGDTVMFKGGDVDQRSGIVGVITSYEWVYRGGQTLLCSAAECAGASVDRYRPQSAKRIDAVSVQSGGGTSGGVGENLAPYSSTAERLNDYSNIHFTNGTPDGGSVSTCPYDHLEGYHNYSIGSGSVSGGYITGAGGNSIRGQHNKAQNALCCDISGADNTVSGKYHRVSGVGHTVNGGYYNDVSGDGHTLNNCRGVAAVGGAGGTATNVEWSLVRFNGGTISNIYNALINMNEGVIECPSGNPSQNLFVMGNSHQIYGGGGSLMVFGEAIRIGSQSTPSSLGIGNVFLGAQHVFNRTSVNTGGNVMLGWGAELDSSNDFRFVFGNSGNKFAIDSAGNVYAAGGYNSMGADYAEFFEWADGNPDGEDRRGMLVSLDGDKIKPADGNGFFGVISASPSVVGNSASLHWHGKYMTDSFGRVMTDADGEPVIAKDFDPDIRYLPRSARPEWAAVGLVGRLIVTDDGSCTVGAYCTAEGGFAKKWAGKTKARVIRRVDDRHVEVLLR